MLKIGDFSRLARISVRMLRHYDEIGLLAPSETDCFTGYRYYDESQLAIAYRITALRDMGFTVLDSKANFVFAKPDGISGKALFTALRARGVLTRRWDEPLIRDYLRISIGSDAEMDEFLQRTAEILREAGR